MGDLTPFLAIIFHIICTKKCNIIFSGCVLLGPDGFNQNQFKLIFLKCFKRVLFQPFLVETVDNYLSILVRV